MSDLAYQGVEIVNNIVDKWTYKYVHLTRFLEKNENVYKFQCEFSLPSPTNPIPKATVKVFFFLEPLDNDMKISYMFENDSLIHTPNQTVSPYKMQQWIERFLEKKSRTSKILFLGTEFEATRIKDPRIDDILSQINYHPSTPLTLSLSPSLISPLDEIFHHPSHQDDNEALKVMRKVLFDIFRSFDREDLGIVSYSEFSQILSSLGLHLKPEDLKQLQQACDVNNNGMIEYSEWVRVGAELVFGFWLRNKTEEHLNVKEEEFLFEAVMILFGDEIHEKAREIEKECRKRDEEESMKVGVVELKKLVEELGGFSESEVEGVMRFVRRSYAEEFPYEESYKFLVEFKKMVVKNGLMESRLKEMDIYLRELFKKYEVRGKPGFIHLDNIANALKTSDKMVLSNIQIFLIQSFVEKDEHGLVDYLIYSRFIGDMLKRFFSPDSLGKKAKLLSMKQVSFNELMDGWTEEAIKIELAEVFRKFDENRDHRLDKNEYKKCLKQSRLKMSEEEVEYSWQTARKNKDGLIELEEFNTHFYGMLRHMRINVALEKLASV